MELDIYARSEDLLGIEEATEELHRLYLELLQKYEATSLLDVGCGRGGLMLLAKEAGIAAAGIDLSPVMVDAARTLGLEASCCPVSEASGSYDAVTAVFDVVNFIAPDALDIFLDDVAERLNPGGLFLFDINTLHGFANVAEGTMSAEDATRFLSVDARFENPLLQTRFTLFEAESEGCYRKEQHTLLQYFHPLKPFRKHPRFRMVEQLGVSLYDRDDKTLLILRRV